MSPRPYAGIVSGLPGGGVPTQRGPSLRRLRCHCPRFRAPLQQCSGYRNTAAAAREIVDNGIEAGATKVHVVLERPHQGDRKQYQRKDAVTSVAFIDNGSGMFAKMA